MSSFNSRPRRSLVLSALAILAGAFTISACGSDPVPDAGTVAVAVAPASINVAQGGTGNAGVTITRGGAFTGPVTLTQTGAPAGVTVAFAPAVVPSGTTASTANVTVGAAVAAGTYPIVIRAAGDNISAATTPLSLVVVGGAAGSIALAAAPTAITVPAGAAAVPSTITITRTAPFAGAVAMTVTGQPAGVTATLSPTSAAGATSTLSVQATAAAVNGAYPLVVHGAGTGIADATVTVTATVTGGVAAGVALTFTPASVPVTAGGASSNSTVNIARLGSFAGAVNLAFTAPPAGITATVTPVSVPGGTTTATATVQASAAVAAGTYNLVLNGTGTGIPAATGTLPVVVSAASGGGTATVTFCAEDAPTWVASQDGAGAWTRVMPTSGSTYQFTFASGRGGVAYVQLDGTDTDLSVIYAALADFTALSGTVNNGGCQSNKVVNGAVSGVGATESAIINLGGSTAFVVPPQTGFALSNVPAGLQDLVATRNDATFNVNWIIMRRGLNPASGAILPTLTFGTEGFAPVSANVSVTNLGADTASVVSLFTGVRGSAFAFLSTIEDFIAASPAQPYAAIPTPQLNVGEMQEVLAISNEEDNLNSTRTAGVYFTSVANRAIALGPKLSTPTVTKAATTPYVRPNVTLVSQAQYDRILSATYTQPARSVSVIATRNYYGALPSSWNVTFPDLSTVTGWQNTWGLVDGTPIDWDVSAEGGVSPFLDATIADGATTQNASIESSAPLALRGLRDGNDPFAMRRRLLDAAAERSRGPLH